MPICSVGQNFVVLFLPYFVITYMKWLIFLGFFQLIAPKTGNKKFTKLLYLGFFKLLD